MEKVYKVGFVGMGNQTLEVHLPAVLEHQRFCFDSFVEINKQTRDSISKKYDVFGYTDVDSLLRSRHLDVLIVSVPHNEYSGILKKILKNNIAIIQEKPCAFNMQNYKDNIKLFLDKNCNFWVSLQRRLYPNFQYFHLWKTKLGRIFFVDGVYTLNISDLSVGWRANHEKAGGGALLDMGYHMIDILIRFFGMPKQVFCSTMSGNRIGQYYDVEDSVILHMSYDNNMLCRFFISRIGYKKQESITIYGEYGYILLEKDSIKLFGISGELVDFYSFELEKIEIYKEQLSLIAKQLDSGLYCGKQNYENFYFHSQLIDKLYTSAHFKKIIYI